MNWQEYLGNLEEGEDRGGGHESWNKGEGLNRRYTDEAMVLLFPISLNKSLKL